MNRASLLSGWETLSLFSIAVIDSARGPEEGCGYGGPLCKNAFQKIKIDQ